jgi:hypothetical protein
MSFLGKVLIAAQIVLSVLFMCASVAVFSLHTNWKNKSDKLAADMTQAQTKHTDEVANLNQKIDGLDQEMQAQTERANAEVGRSQQLQQQVSRLTQETDSLNQQLNRQTGISETKSNEAEARQEEAQLQRIQVEQLSQTIDAEIQKRVALEDTLNNERQVHAELVAQHEDLEKQVKFLEGVVRANNLSTDREAVESLGEPPPPVEGIVRDVRKDQTSRTKFVHITIGSDDGLRVGNLLDVYRTADRNDGRAKYLGKIRLTLVRPDEAVGLVVETSKNGIIEVGDNVTTKL